MAREDFSFFHPLRVRLAEADMQGIVFNGHYPISGELVYVYADTASREGMMVPESWHTVLSDVEKQEPVAS